MNSKQYQEYTKGRKIILKEKSTGTLTGLGQELVARFHSNIFNHKFVSPCRGCSKRWINFIADLERSYALTTKNMKSQQRRINKDRSEARSKAIKEGLARRKAMKAIDDTKIKTSRPSINQQNAK